MQFSILSKDRKTPASADQGEIEGRESGEEIGVRVILFAQQPLRGGFPHLTKRTNHEFS
jgi:hypothetical protein